MTAGQHYLAVILPFSPTVPLEAVTRLSTTISSSGFCSVSDSLVYRIASLSSILSKAPFAGSKAYSPKENLLVFLVETFRPWLDNHVLVLLLNFLHGERVGVGLGCNGPNRRADGPND